MTTIEMYDATNASLIPPGQLLAGYINGKYQSYYQIASDHPTSTVLTITVKAKNSDGSYVIADILDIENLDATPDEAPGWTQAMRALHRPIIWNYCSRLGTWPDTKSAFVSANVAQPDYWVADYTGQPHLLPGTVSTQWTDHLDEYDISLALWPLNTPTPPTPPLPTYPPYKVGADTMNPVAVKIGANGCGWIPTNIPWATFKAATIQGSDPNTDGSGDGAYWPGYAQAQNRNGMVLVCVIGAIPNTVRNVFVLTS